MDEVDEIVAAWRVERPDAEVTPLEVFSRLTRLAKHLERLRKQAFATHELDVWEWDVLSALRRSGEPYELSPGQLVAATMVTSGTMTNRVDRLVARGLVQRRPAPSDRRGVLVRLTAEGRARVDGALDTLLALESAILEDLPEAEREHVAQALRTLTAHFNG
ncbi:MarR family transcriptional regulator [Aeromicrobium sp. 636]|uniref:MarR family transcriptional regulator n=1 Tax=Aeromicrobium senzhongii TaxID=2663859 RepID=A0A8I0EW99_9ACTN|nr:MULTISPECIES: MarR family transcriptional regulator [Aeromicrobium]MBC9227566.1 MarR family transcriptional regulator [Aeromicrobium senzhongii]MCQ3999663.1 MarR family transcriptional regulator [Aeromicrobium sp. 636]MTB88018.1 MarR family transcriptional regulator [Aeromicrobium senzhongii]QNL94975.1 MarR family transcriptional regulator [Aeromicrobium senzhongii]